MPPCGFCTETGVASAMFVRFKPTGFEAQRLANQFSGFSIRAWNLATAVGVPTADAPFDVAKALHKLHDLFTTAVRRSPQGCVKHTHVLAKYFEVIDKAHRLLHCFVRASFKYGPRSCELQSPKQMFRVKLLQ